MFIEGGPGVQNSILKFEELTNFVIGYQIENLKFFRCQTAIFVSPDQNQ